MSRRVAAVATGLLVLVAVVLVGWRAHGGTWVRVETASMGTQAPVGTLIWVEPVRFSSLRPGDLITFRPPNAGPGTATYSHLVTTVNDDGTVSTQGRISAPDPWRLRAEDVVGRAAAVWPGVGWLVVAGPFLALGGLLTWSLARRMRDRELRLPVAVVGAALVLSAALAAYRPLTQVEQLSFVPDGDGARATYVSTGLLPVRLSAVGAGEPAVLLRDGEVGSVLADVPQGAGRFAVEVHPHVPVGVWIGLVLGCFLPAVGTAFARRRRASNS